MVVLLAIFLRIVVAKGVHSPRDSVIKGIKTPPTDLTFWACFRSLAASPQDPATLATED